MSPRTTFFWDYEEPVPHLGQQKALLKKYPELKELMGPEPLTKYILVSVVLLQTFLAGYMSSYSIWAVMVVAYVVGAVCNSNMFLVTHELCHRLVSKSRNANKLFTLIANLPIGLPFGMTFGPYHIEHHMYMGQEGLDTDIPTEAEALFFGNPNYSYGMRTFMKFLFMTTQIFFYAFRPLLVRPETMAQAAKDPWYIANTIVQYSYDILLYYFFGWKSIFYLLMSTFWAGSFHPLAGHFLAEHYVFEGQAEHETFSYYGPLNIFVYNAGYHNVHHDLPNIPWTRLPKAKEICKDYYDHLPVCKSWAWCIIQYIFDDSVGPYSRKKRPTVLLPNVKTHTQMYEKFLAFLESKAFQIRDRKPLSSIDEILDENEDEIDKQDISLESDSDTSVHSSGSDASLNSSDSEDLSSYNEERIHESKLDKKNI